MLKKIIGMMSHNCRDVVDKIELLIDGELDQAEEDKIIRELDKCPHCLKHYNLDKAFKDFVQTKMERKCCHERVKDQIREKIRQLGTEA